MASIAALSGMRAEAERSLAGGITTLSERLGLRVEEPQYAKDPNYAAAQKLQCLAALITAANEALAPEPEVEFEAAPALTETINAETSKPRGTKK